jgi:hypothetical protein
MRSSPPEIPLQEVTTAQGSTDSGLRESCPQLTLPAWLVKPLSGFLSAGTGLRSALSPAAWTDCVGHPTVTQIGGHLRVITGRQR